MSSLGALCLLCGALWSSAGLTSAKGTFQPLGYNLYSWGSGPSHPPGVGFRPHNKHKNWCAFVVTKSVTCVIQNGSDAHVKAEYQPCTWGLSKCSRTLTYRVYQRPTYRVGYKSVTELEWRCCPGYHGVNCQDETGGPGVGTGGVPSGVPGGGTGGGPGGYTDEVPGGSVDGVPGRPHTGDGGGRQVPSQKIDGPGGRAPSDLLGERVSRLEEDNRRLTSSLETLRVSLAGMADRLRAAAQEDASRLLLGLLESGANTRLPEGTAIRDPEGLLPDLRASGLRLGPNGQLVAPGLQEVASKVTHVTDVLKTKSEALDELQGLVLDHTHKIQQLMDISRNGADSAAGHDLSSIDAHLQKRIDDARAQILSGVEQKTSALKCSCDTQLVVLQQQEQRDQRVQDALDGFSGQLDTLRARLDAPTGSVGGPAAGGAGGADVGGDCCRDLASRLGELESRVSLVGDAHDTLNARLDSEVERLGGVAGGALPEDVDALLRERFDDLEARINASEKNAEVHCQYVQDVLRGQFAADIDGIQTGLDSKLQGFEDKFVNIITEIGGQGGGGAGGDGADGAGLLGAELGDLRALLAGFAANSSGAAAHLDGIEGRLRDLEEVCSSKCVVSEPELESIRASIADCGAKHELTLLRLERQSHALRVVNRSVHELQARRPDGGGGGGGEGGGDGDVGSLQGELTILKVNFNAFNRTLKGLRDAAARREHDERPSETSSSSSMTTTVLEESERQLVHEVAQMQRLLSDHGSRISLGDRRARGLRAELGKLAGQIVAEVGRCKLSAKAAHEEVHGFDGRVAHVEDACHKLHAFSQSLDRVRDATERAAHDARSDIARLERAAVSQQRDVAELKGAIDGVEGRLREVAAAAKSASSSSLAPGAPSGALAPHAPKAAAFSVFLSSRSAGDVVRFDRLLLNDGDNYEPTTGIFRVPYTGRYLVSVALPARTGPSASRATLVVSGEPVGRISTAGEGEGGGGGGGSWLNLGGEQKEVEEEEAAASSSSFLAVLGLHAGDTLYVASSLGHVGPGATFSAAMLYETQEGML
ncbi:EMILIN-2-like [Lethenteron reissneri]|uniref:EMILIN-2-like n=1 Tax=Lethenteron reissneri TaxID=7753 RepID=UPI002AB6C854|nr:EMILIN-2-like [Lethenteron reissneri]